MNVLIFCFLSLLLLHLICLIIRYLVARAVQNVLKTHFGESCKSYIKIEPFLVTNFSGSSQKGSADLIDFKMQFNFSALFKSGEISLIDIEVQRLTLVLLGGDFKRPKKKRSLARYVFKRFLQYIVILILKAMNIRVNNLSVSKNGYIVTCKSVRFNFARYRHSLESNIELNNFSLSSDQPYLTVPHIKFSAMTSSESLEYVFSDSIYDFTIQFKTIFLEYMGGELQFKIIRFDFYNMMDNDASGSVAIYPFSISLPKFDFATQQFTASLHDLLIDRHHFATGLALVHRDGAVLVNVPSMKGIRGRVDIERAEIMIPSTLLIDFGLIKRYFVARFSTSHSSKIPIVFKSPYVELKVALSDMHILHFTMHHAKFQNKIVFSKEFHLYAYFTDDSYKMMSGTRAQLDFNRPNIALRTNTLKFHLSYQFAQKSFVQEVFSLFSWLSKQMKGDVSATRDLEPPTHRRFSIEAEKGCVKFACNPLTDKIEAANEAKRIAIEGLLLRQAKAVQILKVRKEKMNEKSFNQTSKEMLFKLFKKAIRGISPPEHHLIQIDFTKLNFVFDGPKIPNRSAGVQEIIHIVPEVEKEGIGRINAGALTLNAEYLSLSSSRIGEILTYRNLTTNGLLFFGRYPAKIRKDYYHFLITCDYNNIQYLIPKVASKLVTFANFKCKAKNIKICYSPVLSQVKQDWKLGTIDWRRKKFKFFKLRFFDNIRLRFRAKFSIEADELHATYTDGKSPYGPLPLAQIKTPNFFFGCDGGRFGIRSGKLLVFLMAFSEFRDLVTIPPIDITVTVISTNPNNETGRHPVFIPIDSSKMGDTKYDPFFKYRTHKYHIKTSVDFAPNSFMMLNLDLMQHVIDRFMIHPPRSSVFIKPAYFSARPSPYPTFSHVEAIINVPHVSVTALQEVFNMKVIGEPITIEFSSLSPSKVTLKSNYIHMLSTYTEQPFFQVKFGEVAFKREKGHSDLRIHSFLLDVSSKALQHRNDIKLNFPEKPPTTNTLPEITTTDDLLSHFNHQVIKVKINQGKLRYTLYDDNRNVSGDFTHLVFIKNQNFEGTTLKIITIKTFSFTTCGSIPFTKINYLRFFDTSSYNRRISIIDVNTIDLNFRPDDFDVFIPEFQRYTDNKVETEKKLRQPHHTFFSITIGVIRLALIQNIDSLALLRVEVTEANGEIKMLPDNTSHGKLTLMTFYAQNPQGDDQFKHLFETVKSKNRTPVFSLLLHKAPDLMKCPVIDTIEIGLSQFIIRIPIQYIKELIQEFPSTEELKNFNIDPDENNDEEPNLDDTIDDDTIPDKNPIFFREFIFLPFSAELNFRRKASGVFHEILERPFKYKGLHMYDIFGKDKLTRYVKRNLKWTAIKSLPSLLLRKAKKEEVTTPITS